MNKINIPVGIRLITFQLSDETLINFSSDFDTVAVRSDKEIGISEYSDKQIGDNGVLKCNAKESVIYPNLIRKRYIYIIGTSGANVELFVGNGLTVNPFKNGGKGGDSEQLNPLNYLGVTTTPLLDGSTTNPISVDGNNVVAKKADWAIYDSKDFIFNGTVWQKVGDFENYYTKSETDNLLLAKADSANIYTKSETYTQTEINTALGNKANSSDVYAKTDTYSKTQADENFIGKSEININYSPSSADISNSINTIWG